VNICSHTFEEYLDMVKSFHGSVAPGMAVGGFMVDLAYQHLPEEGLFDAICETGNCLPDAIQLLTPCTIGNGWLKVINLGRYAITLYDKYSGKGIRVFLDTDKVAAWPEINSWFFKLKPKKEQDSQLLLEQIKDAGANICSIQQITVAPGFLGKKHGAAFGICPRCKEAYPVADGEICRGCRGESPYVTSGNSG